jgi:uncharacterized membrane protein YkoI
MRRLLAAVVLTLALAAPAPAHAQQKAPRPAKVRIKEARPGLAADATISGDSAIALARAAVPHGRIVEAELEQEGGKLIYSFDVRVPHRKGITEVHVDARTGKVAPLEHETDEDGDGG